MSSTPIYDELAATYLADLTAGAGDAVGPREPTEPDRPGKAAEPPRPTRSGRGTPPSTPPQATPPPTNQPQSRKRPKV